MYTYKVGNTQDTYCVSHDLFPEHRRRQISDSSRARKMRQLQLSSWQGGRHRFSNRLCRIVRSGRWAVGI